jgi:type IV pilus biogenesis protein PilP
MGMPGSSMGFPAGQSVQQPVLNQNMGYPYISMPQEHPITIPPQPTDTRPIDGGPGVDSPQLEKSEPISPKKEVDLPRIARIFGKKEHLMAVLTYESGGSCTVFVGDVLPKGGEILSINARGVTVEIDEDQKRSLMFSQQFEGGSTLGAQQTLPGMDMPAPPPLMDEMTPDSTTATPLY